MTGYTFIETMFALSISVIVLLANLYMFQSAYKDLSFAKSVTNATNLATSTLALLRVMTVDQIGATTDGAASGLMIGTHTDDQVVPPTVDPEPLDLVKRRKIEETTYTRTWKVSHVDVDGNGAPDLVGDLAKIQIDVAWPAAGRTHRVTMSTFTTGKVP